MKPTGRRNWRWNWCCLRWGGKFSDMKTRVAVVYGGRSGEHEISLRSAESVIAAMDPERYEVMKFVIGKDGRWSPAPILPQPGAHPDIDVIFPILHGTFGEDGTVQGLFE